MGSRAAQAARRADLQLFFLGSFLIMAMDLLKRIASSPLPMYLRSPENIDKVRLLRSAGLVIAFVPPEADQSSATTPERAAQVFAITQKGRVELEQQSFSPDELSKAPATVDLIERLKNAVERARQTLG
jgi:hypothetical protein